MKFFKLLFMTFALFSSVFAEPSHAALINLGNGTIKDTSTNLIWLQDWRQLGTNSWRAQMDKAEALDFAGSSDWVLPTVSQFEQLVTNVGGSVGDLYSVFTNVTPSFFWTSEELPLFGYLPWKARIFSVYNGTNDQDFVSVGYSSVAVQAAPLSVPEPSSIILVALAILCISLARVRLHAA